MSSSLRRGALAAVATAFSIGSLAACGAGNNAQTLEIKPDNAATAVGDIKLQNVMIITQPDAETKGPAVVSATLFNNGRTAQTLDSISVSGGGTVKIKPAKGKGKVTVPAGGSVLLGGDGNASASLAEVGESVQNGNAQKVTFTFSETGSVGLRAFVVPSESYFSTWGPSQIPTATADAQETDEEQGDADATPTGEASPTDTAAAEDGTTSHDGSHADDGSTPTDGSSASASESAAEGH